MHLTIKNGAIEIKGQTILENVNFEITDGKHIGVVGRNGSGKTTLLKAIIDNELFSEGIDDSEFQIIKIGNYKIGYIEQIRINDNLTLFEELINSFEELVQIEKKNC